MMALRWPAGLSRRDALEPVMRDLLGHRGRVHETERHLEEAARWILRAQDATPDRGVSAGYSLRLGWVASYPECTGYIIPTLLTYAARRGRRRYAGPAVAMAEWELDVQHASGAFPGHFVDRANPPVVFNTAQVIFGLLAAHEVDGDERYLEAARRAGRWLVSVQEPEGFWARFNYRDSVHVYNTRAAWALVELGLATGEGTLVEAAERHLDWALTQQLPNGWFQRCGFTPRERPFLHTIAYASQGLLEAGLRLGRDRYVAAALRTCRAVLGRMTASGFIAGRFDAGWRPSTWYSCLTGNAQMAVQWFRLYQLTGEAAFLDGARRATGFLKQLQDCETANPNIRGAVKGSHQIWGGYQFGAYPSWATKFFMDALLVEEAVEAGAGACIRCW